MPLVVCVEDEPGIRELFVEELTDAGYQVIEAENGKQGLEVVLEHQPDLVLSDWLMPEMSGGELLTALRREHPGFAELPFVLVTAFADKTHTDSSQGIAADAYLTKPVDFDLLLDTVAGLLKAA